MSQKDNNYKTKIDRWLSEVFFPGKKLCQETKQEFLCFI